MKKKNKLMNNARLLKFKDTGYKFMCDSQEFFLCGMSARMRGWAGRT